MDAFALAFVIHALRTRRATICPCAIGVAAAGWCTRVGGQQSGATHIDAGVSGRTVRLSITRHTSRRLPARLDRDVLAVVLTIHHNDVVAHTRGTQGRTVGVGLAQSRAIARIAHIGETVQSVAGRVRADLSIQGTGITQRSTRVDHNAWAGWSGRLGHI